MGGTGPNPISAEKPHPDELEDVRRWFADLGFGLKFEKEHNVVWAGLTRLPSVEVRAPRYGGGSTELAAARSAKSRYIAEQ